MIIYRVENLIDGKSYIGQTIKTLKKRKADHYSSKKDYYLQRALRKYDPENFKWSILYECNSKEELNEKEKFYIREFNTKYPNGYNLSDGGEGPSGFTMSEEARRKVSLNHTDVSGKNNPRYGDHRTWNEIHGKEKADEIRKKKPIPTQAINSHICKWIVTKPNGEKIIVENLKDFCRRNNLNQGNMSNVACGRYKQTLGWKCHKLVSERSRK